MIRWIAPRDLALALRDARPVPVLLTRGVARRVLSVVAPFGLSVALMATIAWICALGLGPGGLP